MLKRKGSGEKQASIGRLRVDHSEESVRALEIIHEAGLHITTVPISGTVGPELTCGAEVYYGLNEIKVFIIQATNHKAQVK